MPSQASRPRADRSARRHSSRSSCRSDAGIAGIGHEDSIHGYGVGHLGAEPLDGDRRRILLDERRHAGAPIDDDPCGVLGEVVVTSRPADEVR